MSLEGKLQAWGWWLRKGFRMKRCPSFNTEGLGHERGPMGARRGGKSRTNGGRHSQTPCKEELLSSEGSPQRSSWETAVLPTGRDEHRVGKNAAEMV